MQYFTNRRGRVIVQDNSTPYIYLPYTVGSHKPTPVKRWGQAITGAIAVIIVVNILLFI